MVPLLLILPCLLLTSTMSIDEEIDLEIEAELNDRDLELQDRDLELDDRDLEVETEGMTEEELEDRAVSLADREGRPVDDCNVDCGRWTNVVVDIDGYSNETCSYRTNKHTRRCTVLYKPVNCSEIMFTCSKCLLDNRDPLHCKKGDTLFTKPADDEQPMSWCKRECPTTNFPAVSPFGNMKVWYVRGDVDQLGKNRYSAKGVYCEASCSKPGAPEELTTTTTAIPLFG